MLYTSVFAMGPAHPPGYPLYVLLGKIWTFLPFGSIPYKLNLFSALCGALTSVVVFMSVHILTKDKLTAIFSATLSGFLPLVWSESVKAEVYTLNSVLTLSIFYLGIRFISENGDRRLLFLGSFVLGIGMGNHHTIGFMLFPLMFLLALNKQNRVNTIFISVLFFMLGFSVYIFSYLRSLKYFSDGILFSYSDSSSLHRFLITFFREEYGSSIPSLVGPAGHPVTLLQGTYNAVKHLIFKNFGWLSVLSIFSIIPLWKRKPMLLYFIVTLASYGIVLSAMVYAFEEPVEKDLFLLNPFMLSLLYLVTVNVGYGLWWLLRHFKRRLPFTARPFAIGVLLLPFVLYLPLNIKKNNLSDYYLVEDFAGNILNALPTLSIVLTSSDATYFPLFYENLIERKRDDVVILLSDKGGVLSQANPFWKYKTLFPDLPGGKLFLKVDEVYVSRGRVFTPNVLSISDKLKKYFTPRPYIMCYRLFPKKGLRGDEKQKFKDLDKAFERFVYERSLKEKSDDMFSTEVKMFYYTTITHYAYLLKKQGLPYRDYYETSLELITPKGLAYYMKSLEQTGDKEEIESFLESIEPYAERYPEVRLLSTALKEEFLKGK
ncbi:MAG: DUF2723 domain-containing protein [Nitrospirae bacterium]|nr:DUF2723 domain-containing protein [Nitrospirota bacterium]